MRLFLLALAIIAFPHAPSLASVEVNLEALDALSKDIKPITPIKTAPAIIEKPAPILTKTIEVLNPQAPKPMQKPQAPRAETSKIKPIVKAPVEAIEVEAIEAEPMMAETEKSEEITPLPDASELTSIEPTAGNMPFQASIVFLPESTEIQDGQIQKLQTQGVLNLALNKNERIQIHAYATSQNNNQSEARRTALARAMAIRDLLMKNNIASTMIDIFPHGNQIEISENSPDRIDIVTSQGQ